MKKLIIMPVLILTILFSNSYAMDDAALQLDKATYEGLGDSMKITLDSARLNKDKRTAEQAIAKVTTEDNGFGIVVYLNETGKDTGIFSGNIRFSFTKTDNYEKVIRVSGSTGIHVQCEGLTAEALWVPYDANLELNADEYSGLGALPQITLEDQDLNTDPNRLEELKLNVKSSSDTTGVPVTLKESKANSGIFVGYVKLTKNSSVPNDGVLHVNFNDQITALYKDINNTSGIERSLTDSAIWKPQTAEIELNQNSFSGLNSKCRITVTDSDMNIDHNTKNITNIKVTSDCDSAGIYVKLYETGADTGVFTTDVFFSKYSSNEGFSTLKVGANSSIELSYCDDWNAENKTYTKVAASAGFQYVDGEISTAFVSKSNSLVITVFDADADVSGQNNTLPVTITSNTCSGGLTLLLEETGASTGKFQKTLYFSSSPVKDAKKKDITVVVSPGDEIVITYNDLTVPEGSSSIKSESYIWEYQQAEISLDKTSYTGYKTSASIVVTDAEANKDSHVAERVKVMIAYSNMPNLYVFLTETGADSGQFKGTIRFGKQANSLENMIKIKTKENIRFTYEDQGDFSNGTVETYAEWKPDDTEKK